MISLDGFSCHPCWAPEVEIPELYIVLIHVGIKGESRTKLGNRLQKISYNQPLPANTPNILEEIVR